MLIIKYHHKKINSLWISKEIRRNSIFFFFLKLQLFVTTLALLRILDMPPKGSSKRKAEESNDASDVSDTEKAPKAAKKTAAASKKSNKTPVSIKDKILHLLENEDKLIGLPTLKKILKEKYDVEDSKANIAKINKILKELSEVDDHPRFGKVGNSYHGGPTSAGYLQYMKGQDEIARGEEFKALHKYDILCPHCEKWFPAAEVHQGEDDQCHPRGESYHCPDCHDYFYTWYTDGDSGPYKGRLESFRDAHPDDEGYN